MVIRVLLFLTMSALSFLAYAVAFEANVDRSTVSEGESILLTVKYNSNVFTGSPDLSALAKDFEVISQNRKNNFQFINGKSNSWTIWTIAIIPKRKGKLTIPSVNFKGESTKPIEINVTKVSDAIKNQQKEVFFHTEVDIKTTYVQAQVLYTEKLYFSVPLENSQLSEVKVDEAIIEQLGDIIHYSTQLNGKTYEVYERKTAIFPQISGEMVIPGPRYTGEVGSRFYGGGRPIRVSHPPLRLQILPKPASFPSNAQWIAAEELTLNYDWRGNPQQLQVGEPITLDLTLRGKGVSSAQIPNLELNPIKGLKYYPDQAQTTEQKGDTGLIGVRQQSTAIVATKNGNFTLPEIRIPWWNTKRQQLEYAVLPAQRLSSSGMTKSNSQPESKVDQELTNLKEEPEISPTSNTKSTESSNLWMIISLVLMLLWIGTLYLWFTARSTPIETTVKTTHKASSFSNKRLKLACRANSPEEARMQILLWAKHQWQKPYSSLTEVAHQCGDEALSSALLELDYTLYSETGNSAWQGEYLWQLIDGYKGIPTKSKGELPPLYPA
jgi:hypothetical protein